MNFVDCRKFWVELNCCVNPFWRSLSLDQNRINFEPHTFLLLIKLFWKRLCLNTALHINDLNCTHILGTSLIRISACTRQTSLTRGICESDVLPTSFKLQQSIFENPKPLNLPKLMSMILIQIRIQVVLMMIQALYCWCCV